MFIHLAFEFIWFFFRLYWNTTFQNIRKIVVFLIGGVRKFRLRPNGPGINAPKLVNDLSKIQFFASFFLYRIPKVLISYLEKIQVSFGYGNEKWFYNVRFFAYTSISYHFPYFYVKIFKKYFEFATISSILQFVKLELTKKKQKWFMQIWFFFSQNKTTNDIFDWLQNKSNAHLEWINSTINRVAQSSKFVSPVYFNWISQLQSKQQQQWWKNEFDVETMGKSSKLYLLRKKETEFYLQ